MTIVNKKRLLLITVIALATIGFASATECAWTANTEVDLIAGQTIDAGSVTVTIDGDNLVVTYNTEDGWYLTQTHLWVGTDLTNIPVNKAGNLEPGQFPYKHEGLGKVDADTYEIPLSSLNLPPCTSDSDSYTLYVAAHASVEKVMEDGTTQQQTGWGNGIPIGKNWFMYFEVPLTCECDDGGCYQEETAWAAGPRYVDQGNWATYTPYVSGVWLPSMPVKLWMRALPRSLNPIMVT